jgi:hypothetical protein
MKNHNMVVDSSCMLSSVMRVTENNDVNARKIRQLVERRIVRKWLRLLSQAQ